MAGQAKQQGRYLYAITDRAEARKFGKIGLDGADVYMIAEGPIAAAVSNIANKRVRPERVKLAAHHGVITRLRDEGAVLPVAFGTIADSPEALRNILSDNKGTLTSQLRRVRGRVEMGLRVTWDVPNIFEYFVNCDAELRSLRDELFNPQRAPSNENKIELGRVFARLLTREREVHTESVIRVLSPLCIEINKSKPRNEREVMRLACLIERDAQKPFEDGVFRAARLFDNHFAFDFSGPWAPYNFVENLELNIG